MKETIKTYILCLMEGYKYELYFKNAIRNLSHKNRLIYLIYKYANRYRVKILSKVDDEKFAKMKYRENTGKELNLDYPRTFNEKLWWLKIHNRDPLLTTCSDKVMVRDYVNGLDTYGLRYFNVFGRRQDPNGAYAAVIPKFIK